MLKLLGAFLIISGCGFFGFKKARFYRERTELFRFLQNGLTLLEAEINYGVTPLPLALKRIEQRVNPICQPLFGRAAVLLQEKKGITAAEAWAKGVQALNEKIPLTDQERDLLLIFGQGLGNSALEEQIKQLTLTRKQLSLFEKRAQTVEDKNEKMWQYLGISAGIVIVLILI